MKDLVNSFPEQLEKGLEIAERAVVSESNNISNVVITGLGGSGIGGTILTELLDECRVPVLVNKSYFLPSFVNQDSLVIVSSYSGNTEESIQALQEALQKKAQIVCVCSGGKILEQAKQHQLEYIEIPGGFPPRSCLGYSLIQLIKIFVSKGLAQKELFNEIKEAAQLLKNEKQTIQKRAHELAEKLKDKITVIYSLGSCEGISIRFRQQINENSKALCWHHVFPEMNHNELVGWTQENKKLSVIVFKTAFDYERNIKRYQICKPVFEKYASEVNEVEAVGKSKFAQFMYLVNLGDWISCYIADLRGIDAVEVNIIDHLKKELSKF